MKHISEEQLVLHYYNEAERPQEVEAHLNVCQVCKAEFFKLQQTLAHVRAIEAPEPATNYEQRLWRALQPEIASAARSPSWTTLFFPKLGWVGAVAVLVLAAFLAGRYLPHRERGGPSATVTPAPGKANPERIILVTVGEHLERSQMLLVEIMSAEGKGAMNLSTEQRQARELLEDNQLYRESAQRTGDPAISRTLDELERVLVEIANGPSEISNRELRDLRKRIEAQGLLFKIRVIGSKVQYPAQSNSSGTQKL